MNHSAGLWLQGKGEGNVGGGACRGGIDKMREPGDFKPRRDILFSQSWLKAS